MPLIQTDKPIYYIHTGSITWPVTESDICAAFPNVSFPLSFVPPEDYAAVLPAPLPAYNPVTQSVQETTPVLTDQGRWEQTWEIVELFATQAERDAAIAADAEAKRLASVPQSVTMRQAARALLDAGLLDDVEALVATLPRAYQIDWAKASVVERSNPLVEIVRQQKSMTDTQIDDLFITAATL